MKFRDLRKDLDVGIVVGNVHLSTEIYDCTLEEYVDFISGKVAEEELEMDFYQDEKLAYAYFPEELELIVYFHNNSDDKEDPPKEERTSRKRKLGSSHLFTKALMVLLMVVSTLLPYDVSAAGYFSGRMNEDATSYTALQSAKFTTPTGNVKIPGFLSTVQSDDYEDTAFTFLDPNRIKAQPTVTLESLDESANEPLVTALLAYRHKFSLGEIKTDTGLNVTQRQLDEATQLAIWIHASSLQVNYQIDANSITDSGVRSLATEITTWATQQVSSLTDGAKMGEYLFPSYKPTLDTSKAKVSKSDKYVEYGPYTVSGQDTANYDYGVLGGVLLDSSKTKLKKVVTNQQFYAKFPIGYTGDKSIRIKGNQMDYSLNHGKNRVWLDQDPKEVEVSFTVGKTTGTNGLIQVTAKDSLTGKAVPGVDIKVSTTSALATVQTDDKGAGEYTAPVGTYKLEFVVPDGYMTPEPQEVEIGFAGDMQTINLKLNWTKAIMNFYTVDSESLVPTGDSEAFIYNSDGKAVKRVAVTKGKVTGVVLPEGDYSFVQYKSSDGYAINVGTEFKAVAGEISDVTITQDPKVLPTTITIDGASSGDSWVYTLSTESKVIFKLNGKNAITVPLPSGNYSVMAQKSDGTVTAGPLSFSTVLNGKTDVTLEQEKGTEIINFTAVDTIKKKPIPNVTLGLFDEDHNLLTYKTASDKGEVKFDNLIKYRIYYVNVLAAPDTVSGYTANGNRFMGSTRDYTLQLYSLEEIKKVTKVDTIYRVTNVTYVGETYTYPK